MLYMKEDDMDEMLRKAAENYEVDADKAADWNAVYAAVHEAGKSEVVEDKKKKRRFVFWWLLLIPLGWIANTEYNKFYGNNNKVKTNLTSSLHSKIKNDKANTQPVSGNNLTNDNSIQKNITTGNNNISLKHFQLHSLQNNSKKVISNSDVNDDNSLMPEPLEKPGSEIQSSNETKDLTNIELNNKNNEVAASPLINTQKDNLADINETKNTKSADITNATKSSAKKEKNTSHYFYTGLLAGGDFSFVHYQKMQPVGYNVGLLVGYKFNKISIESGLFLDKKNYYTTGEYFDKSKIPYFNNAEVLSANGYCKMFEIPLNVKYDIRTVRKHTWFATAGLSSYLMNKEFYDYAYIKDGYERTGSYPYYHTTQNWFSVLNLSAGYQLQTGAKTNLRIEPYYKTTLSGVGTGHLSISSAGINVGIIRRIP